MAGFLKFKNYSYSRILFGVFLYVSRENLFLLDPTNLAPLFHTCGQNIDNISHVTYHIFHYFVISASFEILAHV